MWKNVAWIGGEWKSGKGVWRRQVEDLDVRVALIQALIPIGLEAVAEELQREVQRHAGPRYGLNGGLAGRYRLGARALCPLQG
jgi:hypothetical protein